MKLRRFALRKVASRSDRGKHVLFAEAEFLFKNHYKKDLIKESYNIIIIKNALINDLVID